MKRAPTKTKYYYSLSQDIIYWIEAYEIWRWTGIGQCERSVWNENVYAIDDFLDYLDQADDLVPMI